MPELLFNKVTGLEVWNFIKKRLQQRCFLVNIAKFLRTPILKNICQWLLLHSNHKLSNKCWASLLNQKNNLGWFLLRRFVDLVGVYSLLIISTNHSNIFLLLDLQKNRSKTCLNRFKQVTVHYFKMFILMICRWRRNKEYSHKSFQKCRSSHSQMFFKIDVLINFPISTRKYLF